MITVSLLTPDGSVFEGPAEEVTLTTVQGVIGVQEGHQTLVTQLKKGELAVKKGNQAEHFSHGPGFADISGSKVTVLCSEIQSNP